MLQVGMKALVIGCHTPQGEKWIGSEVQIHQLVGFGDRVDPSVIRVEGPMYCTEGDSAIVYREGLISRMEAFCVNFGCFDVKHLMPIPPLEDPGIDECTFTPIIQKEHA